MSTEMKKSLNPLPMKERMKVPRQGMPEQAPDVRNKCFTEVNLGYTTELAAQEAVRCLECADPKCVYDCPVGMQIKEIVQFVVAKDYLAAAAKIREDNVLPAITGRVCPQEDQCEGACLMSKKTDSLAIGYLERFVADYETQTNSLGLPAIAPSTGRSVAIVGS